MNNDTLKTRAIIQEANEWLLKMLEPGANAKDEARFAAWLRQSPVHVREYLSAEAVYALMAGVDAKRQIDVGALLRQDDGNVVELQRAAEGCATQEPREDWSEPPISRMGALDREDSAAELQQEGRHARNPGRKGGVSLQGLRSPRRLWGTAASVLLVITAATALHILSAGSEIYATARGEQRRVVLQDGSRIDMNTDTELTVRMSDAGRHIELLRGEALFTVARDPSRPFVVDGDLAVVRALGTQFNVYRQAEQTVVTVLEGRVAVENKESVRRTPDGGGQVAMVEVPVMELAAGDQAAVGVHEPIRRTAANTDRAVAWRERRLIFDNQALSEVVAEFNRYNRRQLVIEDTSLAQQRISAVFDADQPEALVRFLTRNTPIEVVDEAGARLILRANE